MRCARCGGRGLPTCRQAISCAASLRLPYRIGMLTDRTATTRWRAWKLARGGRRYLHRLHWSMGQRDRQLFRRIDQLCNRARRECQPFLPIAARSYPESGDAPISYCGTGDRAGGPESSASVEPGAGRRRCFGAMGTGNDVGRDSSTPSPLRIREAKALTFYFDFLEIAIPTTNLPAFAPDSQTTLATDWDTLNSQALAPERTAWQIQSLGFHGQGQSLCRCAVVLRVGLRRATIRNGNDHVFRHVVSLETITQIALGPTVFTHLNLIGDTPASLAQAFALLINEGATGVWAQADAGVLTITARMMGSAGNGLTLSGGRRPERGSTGADQRRAGGRRGRHMAHRSHRYACHKPGRAGLEPELLHGAR